jgi:hypothetical protein
MGKFNRLRQRLHRRSQPAGWTKQGTTQDWSCIDCGVNTAPGMSAGPELEAAMAATGKVQQTIGFDAETMGCPVRRACSSGGMGCRSGWSTAS